LDRGLAREEPASESLSSLLRHLYRALGRALELNGRFDEALTTYGQMAALARERRDAALELESLTLRATVFCAPTSAFDPAQGQALSDQALVLARALGDRAAEAKILWNLLLLNTFHEHPEQAIAYGEQSLAIAREFNLREQMAYTLNDLARASGATGHSARAQQFSEEAIGLWRELGNLPMLADSLGTLSTNYYVTGQYARAVACSQEAAQISQAIANPWGEAFSGGWLAAVWNEQGELGRAFALVERCLQLAERAGWTQGVGFTTFFLAMAYGELGDPARGMEIARQGLVRFASGYQMMQPLLSAAIACLSMQNGDLAGAEAAWSRDVSPEAMSTILPLLFASPPGGELAFAKEDYPGAVIAADEFLAVMRQRGVRWSLPHTLLLKGKALMRLGRLDEARAALAEAREQAEAMGARRALWSILFALSQIEAHRGRADSAVTLRRQAQDIIAGIAASLDRADLRASFLRRGDVRAALGDAKR
ncbi:MAG: hypothetical protein HYR71_11425, partial [Chloroflexi bacterium]|nr:hypothetical protein [Chloroflexota bacterium]